MSGTMVMGIDPGVSGGIAILDSQATRGTILLEPMPVSYVEGTSKRELDLLELKRFIWGYAEDVRVCYVERPPIMPKNGSISLFNLGYAYGAVLGVLYAFNVEVREVRPQQWMRHVHGGAGFVDGDTKLRSLRSFKALFPNVDARLTERSKNFDMGLVEAALVAYYGREQLA